MHTSPLVIVGKIVQVALIPNADFIFSATVDCGDAGTWHGICKIGQIGLNEKCMVYLPDALIPESEDMDFMKSSNWRVKMRRFRGAPSEVLIMPLASKDICPGLPIGTDLTDYCGVTKYLKPIPPHLQGISIGAFPNFIPKTDEIHYQTCLNYVEELHGQPYYITEKCDGSSTTAYRYNGNFGVCSRNLELMRNESNGYWKVALRYNLEDKLPEGIALQWETCGPGIQRNPMRLEDLDGFIFSAYDIEAHKYLEYRELVDLADSLAMPMCRVISAGTHFDKDSVATLGEGVYSSGKQREGVVVRSQHNVDHKPISFKVINLNYEK